MATFNGVPYDPLIDVIARDIKANPAFKKSLVSLKHVVSHRNTLHPSDELLEAWYRFKENQPCPQ